jgi:hypothetical protein
MIMSENKNEMKQVRWQEIGDLEERKLTLEQKKAIAELVAEETRTLTMDPTTIDAFTRDVGGMAPGRPRLWEICHNMLSVNRIKD